MEKIGIYGGLFDPFTVAHREIVKEALKQKLVDKVIIVPTIVDYHREGKTPWLSSAEKVEIIRELTKDLHNVFIDDTELRKKDTFKMSPELEEHAIKNWQFVDTLLRIKFEKTLSYSSFCDLEFYPIIGGDSLDNFTSWFAWRDILNQSAGLISVERNSKPIDVEKITFENSEFSGKLKVMKISNKFVNVSASSIREVWQDKLPSEYLTEALAMVEDEARLLHTPIFDVIKGKNITTGLEPVLVKAPDWVTIIVKRGSMFLVEKQFRYGSDCDIEEFPCGMVESGETPHEAAVRELEEETGIHVSLENIQLLGASNPNPAFMTNRMFYFYIDLDRCTYEQMNQKLDQHEQINLHWEDAEEFYKRIMKLAKDRTSKVPAILLSAFALLKDVNIHNAIEDVTAEPDEYDLQFQEMFDMVNDPEFQRPFVEHY